jgi:hypothetical protein
VVSKNPVGHCLGFLSDTSPAELRTRAPSGRKQIVPFH